MQKEYKLNHMVIFATGVGSRIFLFYSTKMDFAFLLVNMILMVSCIIMSFVFIFLPIPKIPGLKNYRYSLRILAFSYFSLAVLMLLDMLPGNNIINFPIELTAISLQTIMFSFSLINLLNIHFASTKYVLKHLLPTLLFIILSILFDRIFDNLPLVNMGDFVRNFSHPAVILNIVFLLYCILQLIYFLSIFRRQEKNFELQLDDYYADTDPLQLSWVRYCFYGACSFGILMIVSMFTTSPLYAFITICIITVFYIVFGLCYIQYPLNYIKIENSLNTQSQSIPEEQDLTSRTLSWEKLRVMIIDDKYYLQQDVNIEDMAQFLKIGRTTLSNFINKEEGLNFHAWINILRIEEARRLFRANPTHSIAHVAYLVGFSETSNFSRQFKQITKQTPSLWRQNQKEK